MEWAQCREGDHPFGFLTGATDVLVLLDCSRELRLRGEGNGTLEGKRGKARKGFGLKTAKSACRIDRSSSRSTSLAGSLNDRRSASSSVSSQWYLSVPLSLLDKPSRPRRRQPCRKLRKAGRPGLTLQLPVASALLLTPIKPKSSRSRLVVQRVLR